MQKVTFRPICHMTHDEANSIYQQIIHKNQSVPFQSPLPSGIGSTFQTSFLVPLTKPEHFVPFTPKNYPNQNITVNQEGNMSGNLRNFNNSNQLHRIQTNHSPIRRRTTDQDSLNQQLERQQNSIIKNYDKFFKEKDNISELKEQNTKLHFEKFALQKAVKRLKQGNIQKDNEIQRLKQIIENNKSKSFHASEVKSYVPNFRQVNQQNIHFRPSYHQANLPF